MGLSVFHEEAVKPVMKKKIPIRLRNTNNLENGGTRIVSDRDPNEENAVVGIASASGFCSFNLQKFMMNREKGFGRKLLQVFEDLGYSYEQCPSGVDNISVVLNQNQFDEDDINRITAKIEGELRPDSLKKEENLSLVALVGEGLRNKIGVLGDAATALAKSGVNIKVVNQGSSELSIVFGVSTADEKKAVEALYDRFFR
jgi:aspartate kinase